MSAGKKPKTKKVKYTPAASAFAGTNAAEQSSDFGSASSTLGGDGTIRTTSTLSPALRPSFDTASTGLNNNLGFLQRDPNEQYSFLRDGQDPFYNLIQEQSRRAEDQAAGRAALRAQGTGNTGSTAFGGALGTIANDSIMRDNQNLLDAYNFGNENARANVDTNMNALTGLANFTYPLASGANSNLMTALQARDNMAQFNAGNAFTANQLNASAENQAAQQARQSSGSMWGSLAGTGLALGLAPFTGGASLGMTGAMSGLGRSLGGIFGGGSSGTYSPSGSLGMSPSSLNALAFGNLGNSNSYAMGMM